MSAYAHRSLRKQNITSDYIAGLRQSSVPAGPIVSARSIKALLLATTALVGVAFIPRPVRAGPQGAAVVSGSAVVSQPTSAATVVTQSSSKAIVNWQGFSINKGESVTFNQPGASSVTLNRVTGPEASTIAGSLTANGQIFLVNPNGVLFSKGASVNVGGLVASTLDISNTDFLAGKYTFSGHSAASVVNQGKISAAAGGYVSLMGKTVTNDGVISANYGTVAMSAGSQITLNFEGNSLFDVTIDKGVMDALVENKQLVKANGGKVIMTARAADAILSAQVNNTGIVQARTVAAITGGGYKQGSIKLYAYGGTTKVSGKLDASAPKGGDGGTIETSGDQVSIADDAKITTAAALGATGTWTIDPTDFTIVAGSVAQTASGIGASTLASNLANGNVTISSANGGYAAGDINVNAAVTWSGSNTLTLNATNNVNVNAAITGANGGLSLSAGASININAPSSLNANTVSLTADQDVNINAAQSWVTLPVFHVVGQSGELNIDAPVSWSSATPQSLSTNGYGVLNVNATVTGTAANSALTVHAGTDLNVNVDSAFVVNALTVTATNSININSTQNWAPAGSWSFSGTVINVDGTVNWSGHTPLAMTATGAINVNGVLTGSGAATLQAGTDIDVEGASALTINTLTATAANNINIDAAQSWASAGSWSFAGGNINVNNTVSMSAGALALNATNNVNINAPVNWSGGTLTLGAGADIYVNSAMAATGSANLVATYGTGANGDGSPNGLYMSLANSGTYAGRIDFSGTGSVNLEGQTYAVINSVAALDAVGSNPASNYVLGGNLANLSLADVAPFGFSSLNQFGGNFNGFGHTLALSPLSTITISNPLTIASLRNTDLVLASSGDININAPVASGAGLLTFQAANNINLGASVSDLGDNTGSFAFIAGNNVTVSQALGVTGANIFINAPVNWSANTLTLAAADSIFVNAVMTASGTASLDASYGSGANADGSPMGLYTEVGAGANGLGNGTFTGKINFDGTGALTLNNQLYTVITDWNDLVADTAAHPSGFYALAGDLTAPSTALPSAPIAEIGGALDGLGHTITGLIVTDTGGNGGNGLIAQVDAGAAVRNIGVVSVSITDNLGGGFDGGLIAKNKGAVTNVFAT